MSAKKVAKTVDKKDDKVKLILELSGVVVSIIALIFSYVTSQRTNKITELTNRPSIMLIEALDTGDGYYKRQDNQQYGECRTRIRLANIGGADTFLTSGSLLIRFGEKSATLKFSDYENIVAIDKMVFDSLFIWKDNPPPILASAPFRANVTPISPYVSPIPLRILSHTTTDIFIDLGITTDPTQYRLLEKFLTKYQPVNPTFSKNYPDMPHISVDYTLNFSDVEPITTEALVCFFVNNAPWLTSTPTSGEPDVIWSIPP